MIIYIYTLNTSYYCRCFQEMVRIHPWTNHETQIHFIGIYDKAFIAKTLQDGTLSRHLRCVHTVETAHDVWYDYKYITNHLQYPTEQYSCNSTLFVSTISKASPKHIASSAATAMAILKKKWPTPRQRETGKPLRIAKGCIKTCCEKWNNKPQS